MTASPRRDGAELALAADVPLDQAKGVYGAVRRHVGYAKVGLSLFVEHGPAAVEVFQRLGARVFLDLKLHDISNTVELAAAKAGGLGVAVLTVHALGGESMLRAAVAGAREGASRAGHPPPKVLAVTVLTSHTARDLRALGFEDSGIEQQVQRLAQLAHCSGVDGLVCSPHEVGALRARFGPSMYLCTPGIRPLGAAAQDQARAATPAAAVAAGADLLVVGRPIYEASDPEQVARGIAAEMDAARSAG